MKCDECGGLVTTERNAVRRYAMGGLPHVELHGIEVSRCGSCGKETVGIPRMGQLHRLLAETFVMQHGMIAPVELRFLRKHIGLSAGDLARRMGVARETVSRWETGASPMGAVADRLLRLLVITHEPTDSYAVDDLLDELNDMPPSDPPSSVAMQRRERGWAPKERPQLAGA